MTEIDAIKNAQRLYHIIQAIARIRRSVDGISKEEFFENEDKQGNVFVALKSLARPPITLTRKSSNPILMFRGRPSSECATI